MKVLLDANVVLRFLLEDHPELSARAETLFRRAAARELELLVSPTILSDCYYALKSFYKLPRVEIAKALADVLALPGVTALEEQTVLEALRLLGERSADFVDAYLAALSSTLVLPIASFDDDLRKLSAQLLEG